MPRRLIVALASLGIASISHAMAPVLVIHGGAGVIKRDMTPAKEKAVRAALTKALQDGYAELKAGKPALDAVSTAIVVLEDDANFNAGKGAVFTHEGTNELDAAIMDGDTLRAGSVAGVQRVKNPILLARAIMEKSPHVMLVGDGAEAFAKSAGLTMVDPSYFRTEERWQQLQKALKDDAHGAPTGHELARHFGTVGAVALDTRGHLAAGTSTGGMTDKRWGRVGDSPILGAGLFLDNEVGSAGSTGRGEANLLNLSSHLIVENLRRGLDPKDALIEVCKRIAATNKAPRLRDSKGRPNFNVSFYCVTKDGRYAGGSLWAGTKMAVHDGDSARLVDCVSLYSEALSEG